MPIRWPLSGKKASEDIPKDCSNESCSCSEEAKLTSPDLTSTEKLGRLDHNAFGKRKRCIPRYLFRAYGPNSGKRSMTPALRKQYESLNTETAITPHAFIRINGETCGHASASQIPNPEKMIYGHIRNLSNIESEFSSWSPSLHVVLLFAEASWKRTGSAHICVLDTFKVSNNVYDVPDLIHVGLAKIHNFVGNRMQPFPEEYLVHGVVSGNGFAVQPYQELRNTLISVYPSPKRFTVPLFDKFSIGILDDSSTAKVLIKKYIAQLKNIGRRFNEAIGPLCSDFVFPVTMALICLGKRFDLSLTAEEVSLQRDFHHYQTQLDDIIKHQGIEERWLWEDKQFMGMKEVRHMKIMIRALIWGKYGRNLRTRDPAVNVDDITNEFRRLNTVE